jgi:hypothetical protein
MKKEKENEKDNLRTGDDKAGIVFCGQFLSDPYPADNWAGRNMGRRVRLRLR